MIISHMIKMLYLDPTRASFTKYDTRETGFIGEGDLKGVLKSWNMVLTPVQVKWICTLFDPEKSGNLNYRAFAERILDDRNTSSLVAVKQGSTEEGDKALKQRVRDHFKSLGKAFRHYDRYVRMFRFLFLLMYMFSDFIFNISVLYTQRQKPKFIL
jgi:hypothetical protein